MSDLRLLYRSAANWMLYCAALQITVSWVVGFNPATYQMLFFGLLGVLTAQGLYRSWRWLAWLSWLPVMAIFPASHVSQSGECCIAMLPRRMNSVRGAANSTGDISWSCLPSRIASMNA